MNASPTKRQVAAVCGDGHIRLVEQDVPELKPGTVLVDVHASLVSPGTELGGWHNLAAKREKPDPDAKPRPFGYSNAGVVLEVGEGVAELKKGDRVACVGAGVAMHTDTAVVPHNLCAPLPDAVSFEDATYAMLAATSLMALRRAEPQLGEYAGVVGLGIVGHLAARLYQLAGCYTIGWDTIPFRTELARRCGVDEVVTVGREDPVEKTKTFTGGMGLDHAVLAFGGNADKAIESLIPAMKCSPDTHPMGVVSVVGGCTFQWPAQCTNIDFRRASRTGPGYHDDEWETGVDYPAVFMRWTTRTNIALCLRLIAEGKLDVGSLTTHRVALTRCDEAVDEMLQDPDSVLGCVFLPKTD